MWIVRGILTVVSFVSKAITAIEIWLAYRAGVHAQVLADKQAQLDTLKRELQAANQGHDDADTQRNLKDGTF